MSAPLMLHCGASSSRRPAGTLWRVERPTATSADFYISWNAANQRRIPGVFFLGHDLLARMIVAGAPTCFARYESVSVSAIRRPSSAPVLSYFSGYKTRWFRQACPERDPCRAATGAWIHRRARYRGARNRFTGERCAAPGDVLLVLVVGTGIHVPLWPALGLAAGAREGQLATGRRSAAAMQQARFLEWCACSSRDSLRRSGYRRDDEDAHAALEWFATSLRSPGRGQRIYINGLTPESSDGAAASSTVARSATNSSAAA